MPSSVSDTNAVVLLTTLATEDDAVALVRALLDRRLVACGTLLPGARSLYRWEGAVEDARETVVLLKTVRGRVAELEAAFAELHPYAVPELLALPAAAGLARYVEWVAAEVGAAGDRASAPGPATTAAAGVSDVPQASQ